MQTVAIIFVEFILLAIVCFFLISVYLSWILGFSGILLLPYDLSITIVDGTDSNELYGMWAVVYWSTFILAWIILPIQMEYHCSGHFDFRDKLYDSLRKNLYFALAAIIGVTIYIIAMSSSRHESISQVINLLMALGQTYGVLLITVLMGSGLVSLPKRLWQMSNYEFELDCLYITASQVEAAFQEARFELEDAELDVKNACLHIGSDPELTRYLQMLEQKVEEFEFSARSVSRKHQKSTVAKVKTDVYSKAELVSVHCRLVAAQTKAVACDIRWSSHLKSVQLIEDTLRCSSPHTEPLMTVSGNSADEVVTDKDTSSGGLKDAAFLRELFRLDGNVMRRLRHLLASSHHGVCIMKVAYRTLAVLCGIVSALVLWSELMMGIEIPSPFGIMMSDSKDTSSNRRFTIQTISFLCLSYMSICTYWSLFRMNLGWLYTLKGPHQSSSSSLVFNGQIFARLQFALAYNFLLFIHMEKANNTAFMGLMENAQTVPLFGASMSVYVPIFMTLAALLSAFNGCGKLYKCFGMDSEDSSVGGVCCLNSNFHVLSEDDRENLELGRKLVTSALKQYRRSSGASSTVASKYHAVRGKDNDIELASVSNSSRRTLPQGSSKPLSYAEWDIKPDTVLNPLRGSAVRDPLPKTAVSINFDFDIAETRQFDKGDF